MRVQIRRLKRQIAVITVTAALLSALTCIGAAAMYVPDSDTVDDIDGKRIITKTYTLSPEDSPAVLIEEPFKRDGFEYAYTSITKEERRFEDIKRHSETLTLDTDTDSLADILSNLAPAMEYEHNGYSGMLYLDHTTISTEASGYSTKSYTVRETKTISGLDRNDPEYVPQTTVKNGMTLELSNVEWAVSGSGLSDDALVPTQFTATAVYAGKGYSKTADGYITTAEYIGDISSSGVEAIVYTVKYMGEPVREPEPESELMAESEEENEYENAEGIPTHVFIIGGGILLLILAGAALLIWRKRRGYTDDSIYPPE
jgi:hypothetical protein